MSKISLLNVAVSMTATFIVLKETGVVGWSWWGVDAPILIYIGVLVGALILLGILNGIVDAFED